jgi:hypothetical protein
MTSWRFNAVASALMVGLFCVGGASRAHAQERIFATVPFDFIAGDSLLPAGDYVADVLSGGVVEITSEDGQRHALLLTIAEEAPEEEPPARLTFTRFDGQHFLAAVHDGDTRRTILLTTSTMEHEIAALGLND